MARDHSGRLTIADGRVELPSTSVSEAPLATLAGQPLLPNRGIPLDLDWLARVRVNSSALEGGTQTNTARRELKKERQVSSLVRAITCMDLTTLSEDDTDERVEVLCSNARQPLQPELIEKLGIGDLHIQVAAVCVYPQFVNTALRALDGSGVRVATVAAGFPTAAGTLEERIAEIRRAVAIGAEEIDVVIRRALVLEEKWQQLYDEVAQFREACADLPLKVILGTGELQTPQNVARASFVAMMAGADFIKTSTGKELVNATLPASLVMVGAIHDYAKETKMAVGFKPAGGIRTAEQVLEYLSMMNQELGDPWMKPRLFRLGASSLLGDIHQELTRLVTCGDSAKYHPIA